MAGTVKKEKGLDMIIPKYTDYFIEGDSWTNRPAKFEAYKMVVSKVDEDVIVSLKHSDKPTVRLEGDLQIIFLSFSEKPSSSKMMDLGGKQPKRVEFSFDMEWCTAGYPYKESLIVRGNDDRVRNRLKKEFYCVVRDQKDPKKSYLAYYRTGMDHINEVDALAERIAVEARNAYGLPSGALLLAEVGAHLVDNHGFMVPRFKKTYKVVGAVPKEQWDAMKLLLDSLLKTVKETIRRVAEEAKAKYALNPNGALENALRWSIARVVEDQKVAEAAALAATPAATPASGATSAPAATPAATPAPAVIVGTEEDDLDDEDIPF